MVKETESTVKLAVVLALTMAFAAFSAPAVAQDEPTPVPEPAQEEPAEEAEAAAPAEPAAPAAEPEPAEKGVPTVYRDKTLITINGRAEMDGYIELVVQPNNEEPTKVRANIIAKTKKKKITKALTDELVFALGERYKVKQTGDRTILIKSKKKMPPVAISLKTQNLAGVSVMIGQG